jgi:LemA protein
MAAALIVLGVLLVLIIVVAVYGVAIYNRLVRLKNRYENAFAQIDVQLNRRYDLIPNLVETARAYLKHERETLEAVIAARNTALSASKKAAADPGSPEAMKGLNQAEGQLTGVMSRLLAVAENYPDLKANQTMARLMEELTSTENKVAFARQAYNDSVMTYNTGRQTFPDNLLAGPFGFKEAVYFEIEDTAKREAPKVSFA